MNSFDFFESGDDGTFRLLVPPGRYELDVALDGRVVVPRVGVDVRAGRETQLGTFDLRETFHAFRVLVVDTNGLVVEASHFTSSAAGNGGRGGEGGAGGQGRLGGNFASSSQGAKSGTGGQGRAGGYGAPGGGGSGGSSVAQVLCNATQITGVDATTGTAGTAGTRGFGGSNGAGGPVGMNGTASALLQSCTIP